MVNDAKLRVCERGICQNLHFDHRWYIFRGLIRNNLHQDNILAFLLTQGSLYLHYTHHIFQHAHANSTMLRHYNYYYTHDHNEQNHIVNILYLMQQQNFRLRKMYHRWSK